MTANNEPIAFFDPPRLYDFEELIGWGHFGEVYRLRRAEPDNSKSKTPSEIAVKIFPSRTQNGSDLFDEEKFGVLQKIRQVNIVRLYDFKRLPPARLRMERVALAMEYVSGITLQEALDTNKCIPKWTSTVRCGFQILTALKYLHDQNIVHMDLKPANLMLTSLSNRFPMDQLYETIKVCDMENPVILGKDQTSCHDALSPSTPRYRAPELEEKLKGHHVTKVGRRTDIWSFGKIIDEMWFSETKKCAKLTSFWRRPNGKKTTQLEGILSIVGVCLEKSADTGPYKFIRGQNDATCSAHDFLRQCFQDAEKRGKAESLLIHPLMTAPPPENLGTRLTRATKIQEASHLEGSPVLAQILLELESMKEDGKSPNGYNDFVEVCDLIESGYRAFQLSDVDPGLRKRYPVLFGVARSYFCDVPKPFSRKELEDLAIEIMEGIEKVCWVKPAHFLLRTLKLLRQLSKPHRAGLPTQIRDPINKMH